MYDRYACNICIRHIVFEQYAQSNDHIMTIYILYSQSIYYISVFGDTLKVPYVWCCSATLPFLFKTTIGSIQMTRLCFLCVDTFEGRSKSDA